ncbi:HAD hydrolase family protein [Bacillus pumilus]|uniref:HAD hydrolase family protein n=1 Tax=Bacillus pumilus TaxID=1408 RepID=UPI0021B46171|nr:HAD hydrolase family protein [Bacillus pumilus]
MYIDQPEGLEKRIQGIACEVKEKYMMVKSTDLLVEMVDGEVRKGNGVKLVGKEVGIGCEEVMGIGENGKEVWMVEFGGCGVGMGNGIDDVKGVGDVVRKWNNEGGVGDMLDELVLGK